MKIMIKKMDELDITPVQTAIKGRNPLVEFKIEETQDTQPMAICPYDQHILAKQTNTGWKAQFD